MELPFAVGYGTDSLLATTKDSKASSTSIILSPDGMVTSSRNVLVPSSPLEIVASSESLTFITGSDNSNYNQNSNSNNYNSNNINDCYLNYDKNVTNSGTICKGMNITSTEGKSLNVVVDGRSASSINLSSSIIHSHIQQHYPHNYDTSQVRNRSPSNQFPGHSSNSPASPFSASSSLVTASSREEEILVVVEEEQDDDEDYPTNYHHHRQNDPQLHEQHHNQKHPVIQNGGGVISCGGSSLITAASSSFLAPQQLHLYGNSDNNDIRQSDHKIAHNITNRSNTNINRSNNQSHRNNTENQNCSIPLTQSLHSPQSTLIRYSSSNSSNIDEDEYKIEPLQQHNMHPRNLPRPTASSSIAPNKMYRHDPVPTIAILPPSPSPPLPLSPSSPPYPNITTERCDETFLTSPAVTTFTSFQAFPVSVSNSVASKMSSMFSHFTSRLVSTTEGTNHSLAARTVNSLPSSSETRRVGGLQDVSGGNGGGGEKEANITGNRHLSGMIPESSGNRRGQRITLSNKSTSSGIHSSSDSSSNDDEFDFGDLTTTNTTPEENSLDFAYVNVLDEEDEVDIWIDSNQAVPHHQLISNDDDNIGTIRSKGSLILGAGGSLSDQFGRTAIVGQHALDTLAILLSGSIRQNADIEGDQEQIDSSASSGVDLLQKIIESIEDGNRSSLDATAAKNQGNIQLAMAKHSDSAKYFHHSAVQLLEYHPNASLANSLLLLSQTQAKSALALKRVLKLQPKELSFGATDNSNNNNGDKNNNNNNSKGKKATENVMNGKERSSSLLSKTPKNEDILITGPIHQQQQPRQTLVSQKDRFRATLRGALDTHHQTEADISESVFLGQVTTSGSTEYEPSSSVAPAVCDVIADCDVSSMTNNRSNSSKNPVDDMMELENALRAMDMALEMGASIVNLNDTGKNKSSLSLSSSLKNSMIDGSFMVVPPGSCLSSSIIWGSSTVGATNVSPSPPRSTSNGNSNNNHSASNNGGSGILAMNPHSGPRARANRVQVVGSRQHQQHQQQLIIPPSTSSTKSLSSGIVYPQSQDHDHSNLTPLSGRGGLESSWWGNNSTTCVSQILSSSVISLATTDGLPGHGKHTTSNQNNTNQYGYGHESSSSSSNQTKQLMRLMDSLKTLGDENASLLREVEEAKTARMEARTAKEQMHRFKDEYTKRFAVLKEALDKFRKDSVSRTSLAGGGALIENPVTSSDFARSKSSMDNEYNKGKQSQQQLQALQQQIQKHAATIQRQEQLIRKLTLDLKREREESKKKDTELRKFESFYKEVKARSALKAAQRQGPSLPEVKAGRQPAKLPRTSGPTLIHHGESCSPFHHQSR